MNDGYRHDEMLPQKVVVNDIDTLKIPASIANVNNKRVDGAL